MDEAISQEAFDWQIPRRFNLATSLLERHPADAVAVIEAAADAESYSFGELDQQSNRWANWLYDKGLLRGDRIALCLGHRLETLLAYLATGKMAAVALPLSPDLGLEAMRFRLKDAGAKAILTDRAGRERLRDLVPDLPMLEVVIDIDDAENRAAVDAADLWCAHEITDAEDPALLFYTAGTAGRPHGVLHAQRVGLGHLPAMEALHDGAPQPGDRLWTALDWTSFAGFCTTVWPALYLGMPVIVGPKTDAASAVGSIAALQKLEIQNLAVTPAWLRALQAGGHGKPAFELRTLAVLDSALAPGLAGWAEALFETPARQGYETTEAGLFLVAPATTERPRGAMSAAGRGLVPLAGHNVTVVDAAGDETDVGGIGKIRVRTPDPAVFLGYWGDLTATNAAFEGSWLLTGDLGRRLADGGIRVIGTEVDLIAVGGRQIGAVEVEQIADEHPGVVRSAAVGLEGPEGETKLVVAVVSDVPHADVAGRAFAAELVDRLADELDLPRDAVEIHFRSSLPTNAAGRVLRRDVRAVVAVERADGDG